MAIDHALILHAGGIRSLVATALTLEQAERVRITLLHIVDGRTSSVRRIDHTHRQAEHLGISRCRELDLPHLYGQGTAHAKSPDQHIEAVLVAPQLVLVGLSEAIHAQADRVVYPASVNCDEARATRLAEQIELLDHVARVESTGRVPVEVDTPLLELSDPQVIELGARLEVPWELAWSCWHADELPCRSCEGCRRRHTAFDDAGVIDPQAAV